MKSLLLLVVPTVLFGFGIFPTVCLWFLTIFLSVAAAFRFRTFYMIFVLGGKALPADNDTIRIAWVYALASIVATYALFTSGFILPAIFFGASLPISFYLLGRVTYMALTGESNPEEA